MTSFETKIAAWTTEELEACLQHEKKTRRAYEKDGLFTLPQYRLLNRRIYILSAELMERK